MNIRSATIKAGVDETPRTIPLLSVWRRLLRLFRRERGARLTFELDVRLLQDLKEMAQHDRQTEDEVAAALITQGLERRRRAEDNLRCWEELSAREKDVAALTCLNYTNRQIAAELYISPETVKTHMRSVLRKFEVGSKDELGRLLADWDFRGWEK